MKVIVCGGRTYTDRATVAAVLDPLALVLDLIVTGAARGADQLAVDWAHKHGVPFQQYPANWEEQGKAAGPIRNQVMLDREKPDCVIAFPGGRGTEDMIRRAKKAGVLTLRVEAPEEGGKR